MLEDVESDAELEILNLQDAGLVFTSLRVDTKNDFIKAIDEFNPDIILADYKLPSYNGREALEYTTKTNARIPVIMVTGALGDEAAVELLKMGARDYVLKDNLFRLAPSVKRALLEEQDIRSRKQAEEAVRINEQWLRLAVRCGNLGIWDLNLTDHTVNRSLEHDCIYGYDSLQPSWTLEKSLDFMVSEDRDEALRTFNEAIKNETDWDFEWRINRIDGKQRCIWAHGSYRCSVEGDNMSCHMIGVVQDITDRKQAERTLSRINRALITLSAGNFALIKATSELELLQSVTKVIVEKGGYTLAIVAYANFQPDKIITPMAWFGIGEEQIWANCLNWTNEEYSKLPIVEAIHSKKTQICNDITSDPAFDPWRKVISLQNGCTANIALPLFHDNVVFGGLSIYGDKTDTFDEEELKLLEELASALSYGIITLRARVDRAQQTIALQQSLEQSIQVIAGTIEARDPYTAGHQRRVGELAIAIAQEMGLPKQQINGIHLAAIIHDLGKIHIPAEILSKPGKLTELEYMMLKTHPQAGYDILKDVKFPWPIAEIVWQHHEKINGSGYPQGLKGDEILLEAKIISVADVVESILSHRPYRPSLGINFSLNEIKRGRGTLYDPAVVDACLNIIENKEFRFSTDNPLIVHDRSLTDRRTDIELYLKKMA